MTGGSYVGLLRRNRAFRRLWLGQVCSQLGDWLDSIALYTLLLRLTGSGQLIGWLLVAQFLPSGLVALWAGVIVDRLPRRRVMIAADLGCAISVLFFLLARTGGQIWIIYAATIVKFALTSFFEPACSALIPSVVSGRDLVLANAISGVTWSMMLAFGAALGGAVTGTLGTDAAFLADAASFVASALFTWSVDVRESAAASGARRHPLHELREGFRFLLSHRDVLVYALSKALWSLGGGVLILLTLFGKQLFPVGKDGALSIGLLYAARGVGAGIGPLLFRRLGGESVAVLRRSLGPGFLIMGLGYALLSRASNLWEAAAAVMLAHIGGSVQWVFSTVLLQLHVPDRFRGRIFAAELMMFTLTLSLSSYATGAASDAGFSPRELCLSLSFVFFPCGILLSLLLWRKPRKAAAAVSESLEDSAAARSPEDGSWRGTLEEN